jgi:hypothetical protein
MRMMRGISRRAFYGAVATVLIVLVPYAMRSMAAPTTKTSTLYSGVLIADANGGLGCVTTNVSAVSHMISMDLISDAGVLLGTTPSTAVSPGGTLELGVTGGNAGYCKIGVDGAGSDVRAEATAIEYVPDPNTGSTISSLAVSSAY